MSRLLQLAITSFVLSPIAISAAGAQRIANRTETVTLDGVVRDNSGRLLSAAEVVVDQTHRTISNSRGEFAIPGLLPGVIEFTARRIGYSPVTSGVQVDSGAAAVHLAITLTPVATPLGTIVVEGKRLDKTLWQRGFYKRQQLGFGHYFDDQYLKRQSTGIANVVGMVPSVYLNRSSNGSAVAMGKLPTGGGCPLSVFVDGIYLPWATDVGLDDIVNRDDVLAMEVYARASELPATITGQGGTRAVGSVGTVNIRGMAAQTGTYTECGAILIWTKPLEAKTR